MQLGCEGMLFIKIFSVASTDDHSIFKCCKRGACVAHCISRKLDRLACFFEDLQPMDIMKQEDTLLCCCVDHYLAGTAADFIITCIYSYSSVQ